MASVWPQIKADSAAAVGVKVCLGRELLGMVGVLPDE
jgi:hypothetical protein